MTTIFCLSKQHLVTFFVILALFAVGAGCKPDSAPKAGQNGNNTPKPGDQPSCGDCGGADPESSTPEEVKAAIESAFHQLKTNSFSSHSGGTVFQAMAQTEYGLRFALSIPEWKSSHRSSVWELSGAAYADRIRSDKLAMAFAEQLTDEGRILEEINRRFFNTAQLRDLLSQSELSFDINECASDLDHKIAAVSKHAPGARICFNLEQMMKFPYSSLEQQAKAYLVHEVMHILGYREPEAVKIHKLFHYQSSLGRHLSFMEEAFRLDQLAADYVGRLIDLISLVNGPYPPEYQEINGSHKVVMQRRLSQMAVHLAGIVEVFDQLVRRSDGVIYDRRALHKFIFDNNFSRIRSVGAARMPFDYEWLSADEDVRLKVTQVYKDEVCRFASVYRRIWGYIYSPRFSRSFLESPFVMNARIDSRKGNIKLAEFCSGQAEIFPDLEQVELKSYFRNNEDSDGYLKRGIGTFYWDFELPSPDLENPPK